MPDKKLRVAINGLGRTGRQTVRAWWDHHRDDWELVAVNGTPLDGASDLDLLLKDTPGEKVVLSVRSGGSAPRDVEVLATSGGAERANYQLFLAELCDALAVPRPDLTTEEVAREALVREFAAAQRGRPLTVALVRLEGLPRYRAQHGGPVADQLVRVAARTLVRHRRGMHIAAAHAREGMFLAVLSGSDLQGAGVYAARLRADLMQPKALPPFDGVSIGIAAFDVSMESPGDLIRRAMYALEKGAEAGGKVMVVGQQQA